MDHFFSPCFSISESQSKDSVNLIKIQHDCIHIFVGCMNYSFSYCSTLMLRQIWHVIIYFCIFWWNVCIIKTKKHVYTSLLLECFQIRIHVELFTVRHKQQRIRHFFEIDQAQFLHLPTLLVRWICSSCWEVDYFSSELSNILY